MCHVPLVTTCPLKKEGWGPWAECSSAAITSSWTVRLYEAVRMTSEPYADNVPLSFVPLHYGPSPFVFRPSFFHLLTLSPMLLHALFTCLLQFQLLCLFALTFIFPTCAIVVLVIWKWVFMESETNVYLTSRVKAFMNRAKNINGKREGQGSYFGCTTVARTER